MNKIILLLFFTLSHLSWSQKDVVRSYSISLISLPQKVELIEHKQGQYSGYIISEFTKGKFGRRSWITRTWRNLWNIRNKEIIDTTAMDNQAAKKLMSVLKINGIEELRDCYKNTECSNQTFLDGGTVKFEIHTSLKDIDLWYDEIHPLTKNNKEKIEIRAEAQKLVTILYEHINFDQEFLKMLDKYPKGTYYWDEASATAIYEKK